MSDTNNKKPENKRPEPKKTEPKKPEPKKTEAKKPEPVGAKPPAGAAANRPPEASDTAKENPPVRVKSGRPPEVAQSLAKTQASAGATPNRPSGAQSPAGAASSRPPEPPGSGEKPEKPEKPAKKNIFLDKRFLVIVFLVVLVGMCIFLFTERKPSSGVIQPLPSPSAEKIAATTPAPTATPEAPPEVDDSIDENLLNGVPIVGKRYMWNGMWQSFLTGEWKNADITTRRPLAVMIANNQPALPQYGVSQYSVMYEAPVEGRVTRLMGIFEDYDDLQRIGPVRSARDYFVYEAMGKNAIFCNWGLAVPYTADLINSDKVDNISVKLTGIEVGADKAFTRITRPGYAIEYTGYMKNEGYTEEVGRLGYSTVYEYDFVPQFTFAAEGTRVEYEDAPDAKIIRPGGASANQGGFGNTTPYFEYNEEDKLYYRFQSGREHIDERNNEQLYCSNVVLQYAHGEVRDAKDYLAFGVHGEGYKALVFTNGKVVEGTWKRMDGDRTPAKFYDLEGNEIIFNQGKTWICLIWDEHSESVEYE
ncbi:MAG: DUF3048 domain-containing protein [Lachnospiraceae bacterium]|nr:DUF3048 domain-containing protein [Lachnospiraceae bacterium]